MMTDMVMYLGEMEGAEGPLGGTLEVSEDVFTAEDGARFVSSFTVLDASSILTKCMFAEFSLPFTMALQTRHSLQKR